MPDKLDEKEKEEEKVDGLSEQERATAQQLKQSFGIESGKMEEERMKLELKKNHYYLLDENNVVIDTAKIYAFSHEKMVIL